MKILQILYPENFPDWYFSGINSKAEIGSVRKLVKGRKIILPIFFKQISEDLEQIGIKTVFDFVGENFIEDVFKSVKYVDEPGIFIRNSSDIQLLVDLLNRKSGPRCNEQKEKILAYGNRILEIWKEEYTIQDDKITIVNKK